MVERVEGKQDLPPRSVGGLDTALAQCRANRGPPALDVQRIPAIEGSHHARGGPRLEVDAVLDRREQRLSALDRNGDPPGRGVAVTMLTPLGALKRCQAPCGTTTVIPADVSDDGRSSVFMRKRPSDATSYGKLVAGRRTSKSLTGRPTLNAGVLVTGTAMRRLSGEM